MRAGVKRELNGESWEEYYRDYQFKLAEDYLIPVLESWGVELEGKRVLEVGSGNGGCGEAMYEHGAEVTALEIDGRLADLSKTYNESRNIRISVYQGDICDSSCAVFDRSPFDFALMRDVIEHLHDPCSALDNIKSILADSGTCLIVFPPYYSPFGAHQQILSAKRFFSIPYNKLPYIQLLPDLLFGKIAGGPDRQSVEVRKLRTIRMTISRFLRCAEKSGFKIREAKLFLSRPTFAVRYGLPVINASILGRIPLLRELVVTAAYYLLENED